MFAGSRALNAEREANEERRADTEGLGATANDVSFPANPDAGCVTTHLSTSGDGPAIGARGRMAIHIDSVKSSGIRQVEKLDFYNELEWGDLIFCCGRKEISKEIETVTHSPFSHVLMAWLPDGATQWLTIESTFHRGVHVGKLSDYVDDYGGDLVMARRQVLTPDEKMSALNVGLNVLEDAYDWQQEVTMVAHRLLHALPIQMPQKEFFCSGLQYFMSLATPHPLRRPGENYPTPEDLWLDPTVIPICALTNRAQCGSADSGEARVA